MRGSASVALAVNSTVSKPSYRSVFLGYDKRKCSANLSGRSAAFPKEEPPTPRTGSALRGLLDGLTRYRPEGISQGEGTEQHVGIDEVVHAVYERSGYQFSR